MSGVTTKLITAEELLKMGDIGRCELIYGKLVKRSLASFRYGETATRIGHLVADFVEEQELGVVLAPGTGFIVERDPDVVRAPDVSFVRKQRVPRGTWNKYFPGVPDLAVEVISPDDTKREIAEKVNMWLAHGTISCWVADPATQTVTIHRAGQEPIRLGIRDKIRDEPTLRGFTLPISRIFKRP